MKVFLSYASEDRQAAHALANALRGAGHDVYPAAHWPDDVEAAVKRADAFVVLLSAAAVGSPFVDQEIRLALVSERLANRVIPVVVQPTRIPWILEKMDPITAATRPGNVGRAVIERLQQSSDATVQ